MDMQEIATGSSAYNRRDFLKSGSFATFMAMLGGVELVAQTNNVPPADDKPDGPKLKVAVIGLGARGREIITALGQIERTEPQADIVTVCDTYPAALKRIASATPHSKPAKDYTEILADKEIRAVIVATPTHQHKDIVLAALKAGKHVYCEAPMAHTIEDGKEIAGAAKGSRHLVFHVGQQLRSDPQRKFLLPFIRSGALGHFIMARSQWHKKQSWRTAASNPEREKALNWRLDKDISLGLAGELGVHQMDEANWFFNALPVAVSGFGNVAFYKDDGREVPDTIQARVEYPGGIFLNYDATLANSFDADYQMYYGSDSAIMLRESKAWLFKEVDAPLLGWEVYARKEIFYHETGISLVAGASKSVQVEKPRQEGDVTNTPLFYALKAFLRNVNDLLVAENDFISTFGADDESALREHLAKIPRRASASYVEGYQALVTAVKVNEAIRTNTRIELKPELFEI